jgi:hypothetical protein
LGVGALRSGPPRGWPDQHLPVINDQVVQRNGDGDGRHQGGPARTLDLDQESIRLCNRSPDGDKELLEGHLTPGALIGRTCSPRQGEEAIP